MRRTGPLQRNGKAAPPWPLARRLLVVPKSPESRPTEWPRLWEAPTAGLGPDTCCSPREWVRPPSPPAGTRRGCSGRPVRGLGRGWGRSRSRRKGAAAWRGERCSLPPSYFIVALEGTAVAGASPSDTNQTPSKPSRGVRVCVG